MDGLEIRNFKFKISNLQFETSAKVKKVTLQCHCERSEVMPEADSPLANNLVFFAASRWGIRLRGNLL
jgi:hypothetical protein